MKTPRRPSKPLVWSNHLEECELDLGKSLSDCSFLVPLHLLLQLLDLPHQPLLLHQELLKGFPESTVILKCVDFMLIWGSWALERWPVFPKDAVKHCVIEVAILAEKDLLTALYLDFPVCLGTKHNFCQHISLHLVTQHHCTVLIIVKTVTWMMMVGLPGKSLKPSRPSSTGVSMFNLGRSQPCSSTRLLPIWCEWS